MREVIRLQATHDTESHPTRRELALVNVLDCAVLSPAPGASETANGRL